MARGQIRTGSRLLVAALGVSGVVMFGGDGKAAPAALDCGKPQDLVRLYSRQTHQEVRHLLLMSLLRKTGKERDEALSALIPLPDSPLPAQITSTQADRFREQLETSTYIQDLENKSDVILQTRGDPELVRAYMECVRNRSNDGEFSNPGLFGKFRFEWASIPANPTDNTSADKKRREYTLKISWSRGRYSTQDHARVKDGHIGDVFERNGVKIISGRDCLQPYRESRHKYFIDAPCLVRFEATAVTPVTVQIDAEDPSATKGQSRGAALLDQTSPSAGYLAPRMKIAKPEIRPIQGDLSRYSNNNLFANPVGPQLFTQDFRAYGGNTSQYRRRFCLHASQGYQIDVVMETGSNASKWPISPKMEESNNTAPFAIQSTNPSTQGFSDYFCVTADCTGSNTEFCGFILKGTEMKVGIDIEPDESL